MSSNILGSSFILNNVYIQSVGTTAGKLEGEGPLGSFFDRRYDDHYNGQDSYEMGEISMLKDAIEISHKKANLMKEDINMFFGGDLNNQITAANYTAKEFMRPFAGVYAACATIGLAVGNASVMIENGSLNNANAVVSSHNATAERQFRYPNEYSIQKPETTTFTATGAASVVLSNSPAQVRIESVTFGKVVDYNQSDPNDMGRAMAPAAYDTLDTHLKDLNRDGTYYDVILTGDLSNYGKTILEEMLKKGKINYNHYNACGCLLYDNNQEVFQGGSGVVCSALVTFGYVYQKLLEGKFKRVLILSTGALLSPVMTNQKQSIPCICHGFSLEVV
ncbi:MAG: stage V sporulation protein AD [Coprobacillaceae bacterium]